MAEKSIKMTVDRTDWSVGVPISKIEIARWHKDVLNELENNKEKHYYSIRSGNAMVMGHRNVETGEITILEFTNYMEFLYND